MDLAKLVDPKFYKMFAGASWPTYEEFIAGKCSDNPEINQEIAEFTSVMSSKYHNIRLDDGNQLALENQLRQGQTFYNKNVNPDIVCRVPWETMGINTNGEIFICQSPSWVPKFVGNIIKLDDIYTALNSELAQSIRQEILSGSYHYCNEKICGFFANLPKSTYNIDTADTLLQPLITNDTLLVNRIPKNLIFDFDYTCNLKCPSCRTEMINWNKDHLRRPINNQIVERIKHLVIDKIEQQPVTIRWAGGEPFLSEPYLDLFEYIIKTEKPNIQNIIQTNGSYLNSKVVCNLLPYISELRISFDAGSAETYAKTRVNGNWEKLLENVRYITELKKELNVSTKISADFVVQLDNYKEIPAFVQLCYDLDIKNINLQKMWNWETWNEETFKQNNIYNPDHPLYEDLKKYYKLAGKQILNG
jgi:sulfatase maturation enzyme AslB (radical SAM superfamily)